MLLVIGAVHLNLYAREQYSAIPTIGGLFILDVVVAWSLALAIAVRPVRPIALLGSLFCLGTLSAYVASLYMPLFGFEEPGVSYSGGVAIAAEVLACIALGALALRPRQLPRPASGRLLAALRHRSRNAGDGSDADAAPSSASAECAYRSRARWRHAPSRRRADRAATALAISAGLILAACSTTSSTNHNSVTVIRSSNTSIGAVLSTGTGYTLYAFSLDTTTKSNCPTGGCTALWPPLIATGRPQLGPGIHSSLITTVRRSNGAMQLAYAGHPLYTFTADTHPGQTTGEDLLQFGGRWYAVAPDGTLITNP